MAAFTPAESETWHTSLPGVIVSAAALIGDSDGDRVLLVKPNYRDHWSLPGGICELGEAPHLACAREVAEELGLELPVGRMLVVDWVSGDVSQYGPKARPVMHFIFDGGVLADNTGVVLQADELDDWSFVPAADLGGYLPSHVVPRFTAALEARRDGCASYVPLVRG